MVLKTQTSAAAFVLPAQLSGKTDINHLLRELEKLEETLVASKSNNAAPPKASTMLDQIVTANGYNLLEQTNRRHLVEQLTKIRDRAPLLHISFATEPSPKVTETVLSWLRSNVHRYALLQIGLEPAIAAGCVLRTPNKIFDMSLGASLQKQTPYLLALLKTATMDKPAPVVTNIAGTG